MSSDVVEIPLSPQQHPGSPRPTSPQSHNSQLPKKWPRGRKELETPRWTRINNILLDIAYTTAALAVLAFAVVAYCFDQTNVTENRTLVRSLLEAAKYGPSVFDIIVAAVVGRLIKELLVWRLECGEKLGLLDLLAGSTSIPSTIATQVALRARTWVLCLTGAGLSSLWLMSTVGGQAALRVVRIGNMTINSTVPIRYLNTNGSMNIFDIGAEIDPQLLAVVNGMYVAALLSPCTQRVSPVDPWNNVKIPTIETLESTAVAASDGWLIPNPNHTNYSSLTDMPAEGTRIDGSNTTFAIESSYWNLDCTALTAEPQPVDLNTSWTDGVIDNTPWQGFKGQSGYLISNRSFAPDTPESTGDVPSDTPPRTLYYNTWDQQVRLDDYINLDNYTSMSGSACDVSTTYVETEVHCNGLACSAVKIRRSRLTHPPAAYTTLDKSPNFVYFALIFVQLIDGYPTAPTATQVYIKDLKSPFSVLSPGNGVVSLHHLDRKLHALRLGQLLNTCYSVMMSMNALPEGITAATEYLTSGGTYSNQIITQTGFRSSNVRVLVCHKGWLIALTVSSVAMVLASLACPAIRWFRHTPELVLNISTFVRDNPYVDCPNTGTTMESMERARLLGKARVRLGDVATDRQEYGHLAIGSYGDGKRVGMAKKGRLYD
ncbi:hypothetical protein LTR56_012502 [Elasticomyces elasticus]|nr:hypothetical protein LTR56_012502 [Elasticomyces elasticus]KAK3666225.1 hypothetical protein LTR22_002889 [Elasticomyces elasticus]KAK4926822.1 hypothetical protein LTR49_006238 [Elasticomyces elasticus]KAK5763657.1 hypothetical protein LTS12_006214 [Elasticomyces elasticus]